jgi:D-lactate dehydrogenase (cytochrome)
MADGLPRAVEARPAAGLPEENRQAAIELLRRQFGERLTTSTGVRDHHGRDESWHPPHRPDAVVFPDSSEEVADIVRICAAHRTALIAYGTGTSLEGNVIPHLGGVVVDLARMNKVLRLGVEDLDVTVQARVTRKELNAHVRDQGLFFPIDPGADASIGGMAATRASGTNAARSSGPRGPTSAPPCGPRATT